MLHQQSILNKNSFWILLALIAAIGTILVGITDISVISIPSAVFALGSIILAFRSPLALLVALIIVRMSLDYSSQYISITLNDITLSLSQLMGIGIALLGILVAIIHHKKIAPFPLKTPFLIIGMWGIATLTYSIAPKTTLQELLRFFDLSILAFIAYVSVKTAHDFRTILAAIMISSVLPILFGFYQYAFGIGLTDENVALPRIFGTFSHPNVYSLYLFTLIACASIFLIAYAKNQRERLLSSFIIAAAGIALFLTFARVAWVALALFIFLLSLFRYRALLLPLILIPLILFAASDTFRSRITESFNPTPDSSIVWRTTLWNDVTSYARQKNLTTFGSGFDTFPTLSESLRGDSFGPNEPHNDFVKFFVEGGIIGSIIFAMYLFALLLIMIRRFLQTTQKSATQNAYGILILLFIALEFSAITDNVFKNTPVQWLFFITLGALLALSENEKASAINQQARSL
jgi:putative inorganic carbon (hco3(-)) transporter